MIQTVLKRDGRIVGFNEEKIVTAIRKAMLHTDKGEDMQLIRQITDHISFKGDAQMTVEAIQDLVEMELMKSSRKDVAQKYIAYRNQRSIARKAKTRDMFLEIINIIFIVVYMYTTEPTLATIVVAGLPIFVAIIIILKPRQRRAWQNQSNKNSNYNAYLAESIDGVRVSELFARQDVNCSIMQRLATACRAAWLKAIYISNSVWLSSEIITQIVFTLMYYAGVYWLGGAVVSFGVILAMGQYVSRFWQPITNLANIYNSFVNNMAYLERIFETMDEPVVIDDKPNAETLPPITGAVDYNNITFGYEEGQTVLKDVDLHVKAGESIALVGPTGAGKSTIVNLLCRFYDLRSGSITLTDESGVKHDITDVTLHSLRSQMGIMLQDSFIFSGTILDNIRYGRLDATDDEVRQAAAVVRADDFIREMPQGYKTTVNERGGSLSQGQKQLLCIARVMLGGENGELPPMLILDEATSSIDTRTEIKIQSAFARLMNGRTSFIVAHRLSTIQEADVILVMKDGHIIEQGTHEELLKKQGFYANLYQSQFALS